MSASGSDMSVEESLSASSDLMKTNASIFPKELNFIGNLGRGGYGKVDLVQHCNTKKLLAVKTVMKMQMKTKIKDRISTEVKIMELALGNRFLTQLCAFMETPEYFFIIMDYMAGGDLQHFMEGKLPLDLDVTRFFASEMVCGLQFLHDHGIIHRDIKPANVLLDNIGHIRIADFGLGAVSTLGDYKHTGYGGTIGFIAPEMMERKRYNHLVDSFAFGVILYIMVTGHHPFNSSGTWNEYYLSLWVDVPYLPAEMCHDTINIIEGLLSKSPSSRLAVTSTIRSHPFFRSVKWDVVESGSTCPPVQTIIKPSHCPEHPSLHHHHYL